MITYILFLILSSASTLNIHKHLYFVKSMRDLTLFFENAKKFDPHMKKLNDKIKHPKKLIFFNIKRQLNDISLKKQQIVRKDELGYDGLKINENNNVSNDGRQIDFKRCNKVVSSNFINKQYSDLSVNVKSVLSTSEYVSFKSTLKLLKKLKQSQSKDLMYFNDNIFVKFHALFSDPKRLHFLMDIRRFIPKNYLEYYQQKLFALQDNINKY